MMIPSVEQVIAKRHTARRRLKWWALALLVAGQVPITFWLIYQALEWDNLSLSALRSMLPYAGVFLLPGVFLWVFNRWLARRIVILGDKCCVECGYSLEKLTVARCPECGTEAPVGFVEPPPHPANDR